ncbi:GNAT family N-acetyltransferase [Oceanobacillus piezotolerans]|uniref:GNAT family N-acetyltransferase n=1 Tax=Oceanobacillus piezotolerans TaxID=2448030 RepID=A0A498DIG1_9BACI|nr:GNAT family N-acetyltransferase [Oceanobacillus piezotolerans]RLL48339.1 GNAT family N-acetyltransferase [Oceanobacillus piezotolerans]
MNLRLEDMNLIEYQQYHRFSIRNYANEQMKSGGWEPQDAISRAEQVYNKLLPDGQNTRNHYLFTIRDGSKEVGMIWLAQRTAEKGFIYDINIWEENQGKGYGKQAMREIEVFAKKIGLKKIGLHVFGHNKRARVLYEKLGYIETNINMEKTL